MLHLLYGLLVIGLLVGAMGAWTAAMCWASDRMEAGR